MPNPKEPIQLTESVKVLRLWEMVFLRKGSFIRQIIHAIISIVLRLFFSPD